MTNLSSNAQLVSAIFEEVAKGNGAPFWEACHEDIVWRTIGEGSWSGEFVGKQTIIDEIFRPLNRVAPPYPPVLSTAATSSYCRPEAETSLTTASDMTTTMPS